MREHTIQTVSTCNVLQESVFGPWAISYVNIDQQHYYLTKICRAQIPWPTTMDDERH